MPKFNNEDNFVMLLKWSDDIIEHKRLVAYFLAAPHSNTTYKFKNRFKYRVENETLMAKAHNPRFMLYKENGFKIDLKKLTHSEFRFRQFSFRIMPDVEQKKPGLLSKLCGSFSGPSLTNFNKVETFDSVDEFGRELQSSGFNKTTFEEHPQNN